MRTPVGLLALAFALVACIGEIPTHSGYKNDKVKPWKKPKVIVLDEKGEGKGAGELSYIELRRAKWHAVDLLAEGELEVSMEVAPPDDEDFDLAMEVLDPNFQVISRADREEEDAHELLKQRTLYELAPGRYLIHVYLQRRVDTAEYDLKLKFTPRQRDYQSDFPARVQFPPRLAVVPLEDDTPAGMVVRRDPSTNRNKRPRDPKPDKPPEDKGDKLSGRVINVVVSGSTSMITIDRGTDKGVEDGLTGYVQGVKDGKFTTTGCTPRNCKGKVSATPDQISKSGKVLIVGVKPPS